LKSTVRVAALLLTLPLATPSEAGPWAAGKGHGYFKLSFQHLGSRKLVSPDGTKFTIPLFTREEVSAYGAFGLSENWTVHASLPLLRSSDLQDSPDELGRETGFGDTQIGLQRQLGKSGAWVFAVRGTLQLPTGDVDRAGGLLPTGSGVYEGDLVVEAGRSIGSGGKGWMFVGAGPQFRGDGLRDGLVFGAQLGWKVSDRVALMGSARGVEPWSHEAPETARGSFSGVGDRVAYVVLGPSLIWNVSKRSGLQFDAEFVAYARNLASGPVFRVGYFFTK
jgi:hypothetical protein